VSSLAEELRQKFSKNLKFFREKAGMTQAQLAEELNITPRYIQQLEGKSVPNVRLNTLEQIAMVLDIRAFELLK
jgi:transcriptional regulator with XRE-family HTH domain